MSLEDLVVRGHGCSFYLEPRHCGELDTGLEDDRVWDDVHMRGDDPRRLRRDERRRTGVSRHDDYFGSAPADVP